MIFPFLQISRAFHEIQWFFHDLETDLNFNDFSRAVGTLLSYPLSKIPNLSQYDTSNFIHEIRKHANKHLSFKTDAIIKNVKSISGGDQIDPVYMKWCNLKNISNWPFSLEHTSSHKTLNILRKAADMTQIKTNVYRKHRESPVRAISGVLAEKGYWCENFSNHLPQNFIIFRSMQHVILLIILQIPEMYQPFWFSVQYLVLLMTCKCYLISILCWK